MATRNVGSDEGELAVSGVIGAVNESAYVGAAALQTLQQFDNLLSAVNAAQRAKQLIDADILMNIGERRDEFVMECMPQALNFVREVEDFGMEAFESAITVITQRLEDSNSSDWEGPFKNLGRAVDAIVEQAQTLEGALKDLHQRLKEDNQQLTGAMKPVTNPYPDPNWIEKVKEILALHNGLVGVILVGAVLAMVTGGTSLAVALACKAGGTGLMLAAGAGAGAGLLLGGGTTALYFQSVNDAKAKLFDIQGQMWQLTSAVADLVKKWRVIKGSIEHVKRKLRDNVNRTDILDKLQRLKKKWHKEVVTPAQDISINT